MELTVDSIYNEVYIQTFNAPIIETARTAQGEDDSSFNVRKYALELFSEARFDEFVSSVSDKYPEWRDSAVTWHLIGAAHQYTQCHQEAYWSLHRALEARLSDNAKERAAETLVVLGRVDLNNGNNASAWRQLDKAQELAPYLLSVNVNRFCLASLEKSEKKLQESYERMESFYPKWHEDRTFIRRLLRDGELFYMKKTPIWDCILMKGMQSFSKVAPYVATSRA
jgi:hypothetical protein